MFKSTKCPILLALCLCFLFGRAQSLDIVQKDIDSIESVIKNLAHDSLKASAYCTLSAKYRQVNIDKAIDYAQKSASLSEQLNYCKGRQCGYNSLGVSFYLASRYTDAIDAFHNYATSSKRCNLPADEAWAYNNIGNVYIEMGQYDRTLAYYDTSLQIRIKHHDTVGIPGNLTNIGFVYKDLGQYSKALYYLYNALKLYERYKNESGMAHAFTYIAAVYSKKKEYAKATIFYQKAITIFEKQIDMSNLGVCWLSMAMNYKALNDTGSSQAYLHKALKNFLDLKDTRQLAIVYNYLGEIHLEKQEYQIALNYFAQSETLNEEIGNTRLLTTVYCNMAVAQLRLKKFEEGIRTATKAATQANATKSWDQLQKAYKTLALLYKEAGKSSLALNSYEKYLAVHDSITNVESNKAIADIQTKYETEKKDLEISNTRLSLENTTLELNRRKIVSYILTASIILLCMLGYLFYNRYKLKQKAILQAELLKEQQLRNKAIIDAEEKERIRIARELHDGVGQQLSAVKMNMSAWDSEVSLTDIIQRNKFETLIAMIDDAVKEVRSVSHNMMPNALLRQGLAAAIRDFINKISSSGIIKIDLQIVGLNDRLQNTTESVLYRVLQECVSNIIKHANASEVSIQLIKHEAFLNLMIEDNGQGFDTTKMNDVSGIGLKNILSRIQYLNGHVEFDSTPGKGTTVNIDIPL